MIIRKRQAIRVTSFALEYEWRDMPGAGFMFDCDEQGNPFIAKIAPTALQSLQACQNGTLDVVFKGIKDCSYTYYQPAIVRCECGHNIELDDAMTNGCDRCGREYNGSGQLLAPRSQWEEPWDEDGLLAWGDGIALYHY